MNRGIARNINLAIMWLFQVNFMWFAWLVAWLDRTFKFSMPFPRDTAQLAARKDWCIRVLSEKGVLPKDALIRDFKVIPLKQEFIFRSNMGKVLIEFEDRGKAKTLQCIAKFAPTSGTIWNRAVFNMQLNHIKEIFFNKFFVAEDKEVAAPAVYYAEFGLVTGNLCLMMEYMGDDKEYAEGEIEEIPWQHLELVFEAMASLHARYWKDPSARMGKVFPIITSTVDFFDSLVAGKWSIPARKILTQSWIHCNRPDTVVHGDARIGNMMFPGEGGKGRFVFIDWQAVRKGTGVFDLAYFLVLSLTETKRRAVEQQALGTYYELLVAKGVKDYTRQQLEEDYQHACLCVLVLLALPMLSGEASAEGQGAAIFAWGMNIWRERMQAKFTEFDYAWLSSHYGVTPEEGRNGVTEMLDIIDHRLKAIKSGAAV